MGNYAGWLPTGHKTDHMGTKWLSGQFHSFTFILYKIDVRVIIVFNEFDILEAEISSFQLLVSDLTTLV